jgi:pimeloyl-ACP methyl ester carboxylesterase
MDVNSGAQDGWAQARGLDLHYLDWGDEAKKPILLLHGLQDCASSWEPFAVTLAQQYRVLSLDHRGHGQSSWATDGSYKLEDYVGELKEFVEALRLRDLVIIGHSAGGKNAFTFAANHPEILKKLVIVDMDPDAYNPGSASMFERYRTEPDEWTNLDAVVERLRIREPRASEERLFHQATVLTRGTTSGSRVWKRDRALVFGYERPDAWETLDHIVCPTLLIRGNDSNLLTHNVAVQMQERINTCELVELDNAGHWCYDENPGQFHQAVLKFLNK